MADLKIHRLPKPSDYESLMILSRPLRLARLRSLLEDAHSFMSKYEDEIDQPEKFWLDRLKPDNVQHFVATRDACDDNNAEYKAVLVLITESMSGKKHNTPTYLLAAFWVASEVRGQKVGSRLIEETMKWIQEDAKSKGWPQVRYRLGVEPNNFKAMTLYKRLGFAFVSKDSSDNDDPFEDDFLEMRMILNIT